MKKNKYRVVCILSSYMPLNETCKHQKNKKKIIFFTYIFLKKKIHQEYFHKSFCLSNADYFGPKAYNNLQIEVDDNFFD